MLARGFEKPNHKGWRRVVVSFPDEDFEEIRKRAEKDGTSFAEQVRILVTWGLDSELT